MGNSWFHHVIFRSDAWKPLEMKKINLRSHEDLKELTRKQINQK